MNAPLRSHAVTGAAMDVQVPRRRGRQYLLGAVAAAAVVLLGVGAWRLIPQGMQVPLVDVRIAPVTSGMFRDDIVARAKAEALTSVILDAIESGRVEEVLARDGALVKQGEVLFRISNAQRNLELLQRQSEHAQQISNLANLRVNFEAGNTEYARRLAELQYTLEQARKKHERNTGLAAQGFIAKAVLDESADALSQQERLVKEAVARGAAETQVKLAAVNRMELATRTIEQGLTLVDASVAALVVRAPAAGRLTAFKLQIGEVVRNDQHIGRIDDPHHFKLTALLDEYYLNRVAVGRQGSVRQDGQDYPVEVTRVYPQISEGRFTVELGFKGAQPATLNPGQSVDAQITLGQPKAALLLPNAPFLGETGGAWVFVLAPNGIDATKRLIKTGRRNHHQVEVLSGLAAGEKVIVSSYSAFSTAEHVQLKK